MEISRENIEAVLLDYSEGILNPEEIKELEIFVLLHPEFKELMELALELPVLDEDQISLSPKRDLRKYSFASSDEAFVKEIENDLTATEEEELKDMLHHFPELEKDRTLFAHTILQPEVISFPEKEQLKRRSGVIVQLYPMAMRIAALFLIALLTGGVIYSLMNTKKELKHLADQTTPKNIQTNDAIQPAAVKNKTQEVVPVFKASSPVKSSSKSIQSVEETQQQSEPQELIPMPTVNPSLAVSVPSRYLIVEKSTVPVKQEIASVDPMPEEHYMDVYEAASKLLNRISNGKIGFTHKKSNEGNFTELAVNSGDFEFVRKKSK